ncbi:uncharacterized protein K02A2.6-like [Planococcus citri]|uniref:uncharacterized protein K02A2.6-like n=1 Tax=Planococcus citri TaxID=170843 RepID=UPI0031F93A04
MKQLAQNYCYWSGIDADLERLVKSCVQCSEYQKQPAKVKVHHWEIPENNFDRIHIDFTGPRKGYQFLIVVDAKSKWPEIKIFNKDPTSLSTMLALEELFTVHGYPKILPIM